MIEREIKAKNNNVKLSEIQPMFGKIYSDEMLLQRLLNKWDDDVATSHMVAFFKGHSNIYSLVLINLNSALDYSNNLLLDYDEEDGEYNNIQETINYLQDKIDSGYQFLNVDGQHRINCYQRFLSSEFALTESVICQVPTANEGEFVTVDLKGTLYKDMSTYVQEYIMNEYELLVTMIEEGTLQNMVDVTIFTNLGEPWNTHEMRIILPSSFNQFVHNMMTNNPLLTKVFEEHLTGMSGNDYKLEKKGDSRVVCEQLGYLHNSRIGNYYDWPKDDTLDRMSSIQGLTGLTKKTLTEGQSIMNKMAELVHSDGNITKMNRGTWDNLFLLMSTITNPKHDLNPYNKAVGITNPIDFFDWFMKTDLELREKDKFVIDPNTGKVMVNPTTNTKLKNSESFNSKCGAKKSDDIKLRLTELINAFTKSYPTLFGNGTVKLVEKDMPFTKTQKKEVAVESNWKSIDGEDLKYSDVFSTTPTVDGDHKKTRYSGGTKDTKNLGLRKSSANRRKNKKTEAFSE